LGSVAWTAEFLLKLYGPLIPAALILPLFWLRTPLVAGLWLSALAVILYFAPKPVLFERNLSLGIFAAAVALAILSQRSRIALACALLALLPMTWWSTQIAASNTRRFNTFAAPHFTEPVTVSDAWQADLANCRGLILLRDYGDPLSARLIAQAASEHQVVARYHSRFEALPASTLQAYVDPGHVLLRCKP
jgi:hypothetical protein